MQLGRRGQREISGKLGLLLCLMSFGNVFAAAAAAALQIPKTGKGAKASKPVNKDRFIRCERVRHLGLRVWGGDELA